MIRKNKWLLLAILFVFTCPSSFGQYKDLKFKRFSNEAGLSNSSFTCFAQTPDGFLWVGTTDGLNRFDGYSFKVYRNNPEDTLSISDNHISTLFVDHKGDLWVGTKNNGLNRYTSKTDNFISYKSKIYDSKTLTNHYITSITEDADQNLWVGTIMGLNLYNQENEAFIRYFYELAVSMNAQTIDSLKARKVPAFVISAASKLVNTEFKNERALFRAFGTHLSEEELEQYKMLILKYSRLQATADHIRALEADANGNIWIGYDKEGLGYFNPKTNKLNVYQHNDNRSTGISGNEVMSLAIDHGDLWVGTRDGKLCKWSAKTDQFTHYQLPGKSYNIESIAVDSRGTVWVGDDYGLCRFDKEEKRFYRYQNQENNKYSLSATAVKQIFEDIHNDIWVGCSQGGINLTLGNLPFQHLKYHPNSTGSLTKTSVSSVMEDSRGNIWVGYYTMGVDVLNPQNNKITHFFHDPGDSSSLGKGTVFEIFEDSDANVWIGTYEGGLQMFDKSQNRFITYKHSPDNLQSIGGNDIRDIAEDEKGNLWLAIHGQGIDVFDRKTRTVIKRYKADYLDWQNSLSNDWVYTVHIDKNQNVWVGSVFGLSLLKRGADNFVSYTKENRNISHNHVRSILEDGKGNIWIGTENGLNLFDKKTTQFISYYCKDGLPNNTIHGILEDEQHKLWISTNHGLSRLDPAKGLFENYNILDGLQSNEFYPGAFCKGKSGSLYFGGINGLSIFNPKEIKKDSSDVSIKFTGLSLFNKSVEPGKGVLINSLDQTAEISLNHDQNIITLSFVGLDFKKPEKIQYAYKLEGFDKNWNYVGDKREATYTNLDPGVYTFKVKAANSSGIWSKNARELKISISPPFWRTLPAYALYSIILVALIYYYKHTAVAKERLKNQIELQKLEAQKTHELDVLKLKFFTSISHEFRTPLTLILDPVSRLISEGDTLKPDEKRSYYNILQENSQRLLKLVNQVLDMSEIDAGCMPLAVSRQDIVQFCRAIRNTFSHHARQHETALSFSSNTDAAAVYFDSDVLEKILINLISNAFKFTPKSGTIHIQLLITNHAHPGLPETFKHTALNSQFARLTITDNGSGIPERYLTKIFERFFKVDNPHINEKGSGIGLALTKQLIERHYGTIDVQSKEGEGSEFTLWLPVSKESYAPKEIVKAQASLEKKSLDVPREEMPWETDKDDVELSTRKLLGLPSILIIEDSNDLRKYISLHLQKEYIIYEADNGEKGFKIALEVNPDLIITDVMMAGINGLDVCRKIKNNTDTSHIPVVLLTARSSDDYELEGLKTGASDYISKPFNMLLLKARVKNIIESRQSIQDKLSHDPDFEPLDIALHSLPDQMFFKELVNVIHENISDESLSPDKLASMMNLSRSQLYRKVKGLTGLSVSILIRNLRLSKACKLLKSQALTISEVAYEVGFSDPGYFTKCFKEMYSHPPSEHLKNS